MRSLTLTLMAIVAASACASSSSSPASSRGGIRGDASDTPPAPPDASPPTSEGAPDASAPPPDAAPPPPPPSRVNVTTETVQVGSDTREYVLAVPKTYDAARSYPLVLVFHGDGGTGAGIRAGYTFDAVSNDDAIVAYPSGLLQTWDLYTPVETNRDVAFVAGLIGALKARLTIDTTRVFGTGFSNGSFFINQLACMKSGLLRAIASHAGGAPYEPDVHTAFANGYFKCSDGETGVAALVVHGTADNVVELSSGQFSAEYWRYVNGCSNASQATAPAPCVKYTGCPTDRPVVMCIVPDLGHGVWIQGPQTSWDFFRSL